MFEGFKEGDLFQFDKENTADVWTYVMKYVSHDEYYFTYIRVTGEIYQRKLEPGMRFRKVTIHYCISELWLRKYLSTMAKEAYVKYIQEGIVDA